MPAAAWFTLIVAALIIAITAVGLLRVMFLLRAMRKTVVATSGGVQAVASLTSTVPDRLTSVNASLKPVRDFCETV
jgi:cytochrome c biogenesis protein ResB